MIPTFPNFKHLEWSDKRHIEQRTRVFDPYSDYNFVTLWCWNTGGTIAISVLNDNLVIRTNNWQSVEDDVFSFIGIHAVLKTAETLISYADQQGLTPRLKFIPGCVVAADDAMQRSLMIVEDLANFDYIYSLRSLAETKGRRYHEMRRKINLFQRYYNADFRIIDLRDARMRDAMLDLCDSWAAQKLVTDDVGVRNELLALKRLFDRSTVNDLVCHGLFENDVMRAFALTERVSDLYVMGHFLKADRSYQGIYQYLMQRLAVYWLFRGTTFLNLQVDGGYPGLIQAKREFRPCDYLKKYILTK